LFVVSTGDNILISNLKMHRVNRWFSCYYH